MTSYLENLNLVYFEITTRECKSMRYNQKLVLLLLWFCTMQDKLAFFHQKREYMKSSKQFQLPWIYHMYLHILLEFGWNVDIQNFGCMWLFMFSTYSFSYISKTFWKGVKETCSGNLLFIPWCFSTCITPNPLGLRFCITHAHLTKICKYSIRP